MTMIELEAYVSDDGEIHLKLPSGISVNQLRLRVELVISEDTPPESAWTDEEIAQMMRSDPKTGAEIADSDAIGGWEHKGISDSVAFVEELRHKDKEARKWSRD